jgi:2'-5' RNA ligase
MSGLVQVDPVPIEWLHLTMQGVGFPADVSTDEVDRVADRVQTRLADLAPATLTFHRPVLLPEAIALPPEPARPVHEIRSAIQTGIADVWGRGGVPEAEDGFRAHVSLGYVNHDGPAEPILAALRSIDPPPATVSVRAASLILLDRDTKVYRWSAVQEVPLGAAFTS